MEIQPSSAMATGTVSVTTRRMSGQMPEAGDARETARIGGIGGDSETIPLITGERSATLHFPLSPVSLLLMSFLPGCLSSLSLPPKRRLQKPRFFLTS
jgi:hypothetical protein